VTNALHTVRFGVLAIAWTTVWSWTPRATPPRKDAKQSAKSRKARHAATLIQPVMNVSVMTATGQTTPNTASSACRTCLATKNKPATYQLFAAKQ